MQVKDVWKELCQGEWEFVVTKVKNKVFHNYIPTVQTSDKLPTVLLCSSARSGSTWLMELLLKSAKYRSLFEAVPNAGQSMKDFGTPRYILSAAYPPDAKTSSIASLFEYERQGWSQRHRNSRNIYWRTQGLLIKSTRAGFCLDFLDKQFADKPLKVIVLLRNPFDVVRSKILKKNVAGGEFVNKFSYDPAELFHTDDPYFKAYFESYRPVLEKIESEVQRETFVWCLENKWILDSCKDASQGREWTLVTYEDLVVDFEQELRRLLKVIGIPFKKSLLKSRQVKSSTAYTGNGRELVSSSEFQPGAAVLNQWQSFFSETQVSEMVGVMRAFGIDYNSLLGPVAKKAVTYPA